MWKNSNRWFYKIIFFAASLAVVSCGTKKAAVDATSPSGGIVVKHGDEVTDAQSFVRKVHANQVGAGAISAKIKFTLKQGQKDLSVSGSLKMK